MSATGCVTVVEGRRWLCADGAEWNIDGMNPGGYNPPEDLAARLKLRREYHTTWLKFIEADFASLQAASLGKSGEILEGDSGRRYKVDATFDWPVSRYGPAPVVRDPKYGHLCPLAALRFLKGLADGHRAALVSIDLEWTNSPEGKEEQRREAERVRLEKELAPARAEMARKQAARQDEIASMTL